MSESQLETAASRAAGIQRASIDHLSSSELEQLQLAAALVTEPCGVRPRYFDGRFLAARDLQRDQDFFFHRQRELAGLAGAGVLAGLQVLQSGDSEVAITPGVGLTEQGELVVLPDTDATAPDVQPLRVDLADLPTIQRLSFELGALDAPTLPARRPSGAFVLALRSVQYTANPQAAYPASLAAQRKVEDGDVIEAVAVTLIPFPDAFADLSPSARRAAIARSVFLGARSTAPVASVVPLALLELDAGRIRWLDMHLVRREIGAEPNGLARGVLRSRARQEAHALHYQQHLADVLAARRAEGASLRFPASQAFLALPPVGSLPAAAVDLTRGSQLWFPDHIQTNLVLVPPDEIAALVQESLLLPPIDLQQNSADSGAIAVLILKAQERFGAAAPIVTSPPPVRRSGGPIGSLADILRGGF
jgi:hypothetical protein